MTVLLFRLRDSRARGACGGNGAHGEKTSPAEPASPAVPVCDLCGDEPGKWILRGALRDIVLCGECATEHVPQVLAIASGTRLLEWGPAGRNIPVVVIQYGQILAERAERYRGRGDPDV